MELTGPDRDLKIAELRGTLASPGWQVIADLLKERQMMLQRLIMVSPELRPKGMSSERLRAEYAVLMYLLDKPLELIESYDTLVRESLAPSPDNDWIARALNEGMGFAGFPQANPEE